MSAQDTTMIQKKTLQLIRMPKQTYRKITILGSNKTSHIFWCTNTKFLQSPKMSYMEAALRIVRNIKQQPTKGFLLSTNDKNEVITYYDVDWVASPNTRR